MSERGRAKVVGLGVTPGEDEATVRKVGVREGAEKGSAGVVEEEASACGGWGEQTREKSRRQRVV